MCFTRCCLKKSEKHRARTPERFSRDVFLTFSGTPHAKHLLLRRFLDGRGPKLVSKVSDSYEAVQQKSKKHHARAPSRAKSDDPLSKNNDFAKSLGMASPGVENVGGPRGSILELCMASQLPYKKKVKQNIAPERHQSPN